MVRQYYYFSIILSANLPVNTPIPTPTTAEAIITVANNPEPIIEPIVIPPDKLEKLKKFLASKNILPQSKNIILVNTCGKCMCGLIPEFKLIYHYDGIIKVEKYCTKCLNERIPNQEKGKEIESQMTVVESCSEYIESLEKEQEANNNHV
jgi:hypothetical protein